MQLLMHAHYAILNSMHLLFHLVAIIVECVVVCVVLLVLGVPSSSPGMRGGERVCERCRKQVQALRLFLKNNQDIIINNNHSNRSKVDSTLNLHCSLPCTWILPNPLPLPVLCCVPAIHRSCTLYYVL